jgi:CBS domain containing-hemolysin-like protein
MTVLLMLFCDISPKVLVKDAPELTALNTAPFLRFFMIILTPVNYLTTQWKKLLQKIFPVKVDRSTSEDELLTYVEEVRQEGGINIHEEHMIRQVIGFDDLKVSDIFTPRIDVEAVPDSATIEEIDQKFIETGFFRLPVFKDTIDNITGIILLKDFYHEVMKGTKSLPEIIKPVVFITKTIKIGKLLKSLQKKQSHMAVVVDEHGGTLGIVTIEDIVEELVGEIWDEHDEVVESVKKENDGSYVVLGLLSFKDMLEAIADSAGSETCDKPEGYDDSDQEEHKNEEVPDTTVANWIMESLGRLPRAGETLSWKDLSIKVLRIKKQRIMEVSVRENQTLVTNQ